MWISFIMNAPLVCCPFLVIIYGWPGATANPSKNDDWKWATDRRFIHDKRLLKKSTVHTLVTILKALVESLNPRGPPMTAIRLEAFLGFISQILKTFLFCFNGSQV